ncbi:MAG: MgtC/SapB family protein [Chitinophagales bacterium]|nr:MgtC/SapB family protein [Chitinophagales bacterium]
MLSSNEIILRLVLAALLGGLIGVERERKEWTAGMRTHMMVCLGSCLIMLVSSFGFSEILSLENEHIALDPSRVAAQVVSGIGFLGAGTIIFLRQGVIHGLTTAAGLWTVAAIGLAIGGGLYLAAGATTFIALAILWALQPIERRIAEKLKKNSLKITTALQPAGLELFNLIMENQKLNIDTFTISTSEQDYIFEMKGNQVNIEAVNAIIEQMKDKVQVKEMLWLR